MAKGKSKNRSDYESVKYEKLEQNEDEEEDDDVMFSREGITSREYDHDGISADGNHVQLEKATLVRNSDMSVVHFKKSGLFTNTRNFCCVALIIFCIVTAVFFGLIFPRLRESVRIGIPQKGTASWEQNFYNYSTESCVRLYDVDGDGQDDIIVGLAMTERVLHIMDMSHKQAKEFCHSIGEGEYCVGNIVAVRGSDGQVLWQLPTLGVVFEINCGHLDVDLDGKTDCVGTGRFASVIAFNPRNGHVYWRIDESRIHGTWNTYNVLVLPDVTGDGVKDIVVPNGGDPKIPPEVHLRHSGELLLLDGSNGQVLGRSLNMTDSYGDKETYMSPVLHTTKDGSMYLLYGSGGETVGGSFYAISLCDFYKHVMGKTLPQALAGPGSYGQWGRKQKSEEGIIEIYSSRQKGVMVPPVLVDMTGDGVREILMLAYDGIITLYNGESLEAMWTANFSGYETYSTPAPGYFTNDDTLDFMLHLSSGFWPDYDHSLSVVLDGTDGKVVWSVFTTRYEMSSDLVAMTTEHHQDMFILRIQGRPELSGNPSEASQSKEKDDPKSSSGAMNSQNYGTDDQLGYKPKTNPGYQPPNKDDLFDTFKDPGAPGGGDKDNPYRQQNTEGEPNHSSDSTQGAGEEEPGGYPVLEGPDAQQHIVLDNDFDSNFECSEAKGDRTTEVFVVDRSSFKKPLRIYSVPPVKVYYDLTDADRALVKEVNENRRRKDMLHKGSNGNQSRSRRTGEDQSDGGKPIIPISTKQLEESFSGSLCMLFEPSEKTTGALGDLDGDGELDLVMLFDMGAGKHDETGQYFDHKANTRLVKLNLKEAISRGVPVDLHPKLSGGLQEGGRDPKTFTFKKKEEQAWAAYLGSQGDSTFHTES